jgi:hypothetical protein
MTSETGHERPAAAQSQSSFYFSADSSSSSAKHIEAHESIHQGVINMTATKLPEPSISYLAEL